MWTAGDLAAARVTLTLAAVTTALLLVLGTPLAWWLARSRGRWRVIVESVVALPLVLPPTVLGFYLLLFLGRHGPLASVAEWFGLRSFAFTFPGLVIGSFCYSLPFVVQPIQNAFVMLEPGVLEAAATLRASPLDRFFTVALPMARTGLLTAVVLGFAHTVGEFGVVLMIGGNIPGKTQVLSIAIYDHVEALEYGRAHLLAGALLGLSFVSLLAVYVLNRRFGVVRP